jgi:hypothetical protein
MADEKGELREVNYRQLLPWTELFRAFQIALDPRKLLLAAAAILVMNFGWWLLALVFASGRPPDKAPPALRDYVNDAKYKEAREAWEKDRAALKPGQQAPPEPQVESSVDEEGRRHHRAAHREWAQQHLLHEAAREMVAWPWSPQDRGRNPVLLVYTGASVEEFATGFGVKQIGVLLEPLAKFLRPISLLLSPNAGFLVFLFCLLGTVWTLATWAIFGGAITRIAALQVARKEKIALADAVRFSTSKFLSFLSAPLIPLLGVAGIVAIMTIVGGLLLHVPWIGDILGSVLWFLPLLGGLFMAGILLGLLGWPLMYATISTEGSDSFDAISRSYSYVYSRPWHYIFYLAVALLYGIVVVFFVVAITSLFVFLAKWGLSFTPFLEGYRDYRLTKLFVFAPMSYEWRDLLTANPDQLSAAELYSRMDWAQRTGAFFVGAWLHLAFLMMIGFAYSYFWSTSTLIYFLLRKQVDDTDLDEVYPVEEEEEGYPAAQTTAPAPQGSPAGGATLPMAPERPRAPEVPQPQEPLKTEAAKPEPPKPDATRLEAAKPEPPASLEVAKDESRKPNKPATPSESTAAGAGDED